MPSDYYCESMIIAKAEEKRSHPGAGNYGCHFNFQPREQIKEGVAYKTLVDESKELISATKASLQNLYLKGLQMNNQDRN
jgi:hypothetical protein